MLVASRGETPKKSASNLSTSSSVPAHLAFTFPIESGLGSKSLLISHLFEGNSLIASTPLLNSLQKESGSLAPPGNRQPRPMMAIGSVPVCSASQGLESALLGAGGECFN